jgi:hypothetical protein
MYIRTAPHSCKAWGILASKIARRISRKIFSSERLLTNGHVASRELPGFKFNLCKKEVIAKIRDENIMLPGLGIIDAVCDSLSEGDSSCGNIAISDLNLTQAHYSKIDFEYCRPDTPGRMQKFYISSVYPNYQTCAPVNYDRYRLEVRQTQLKFALFTTELLAIDVPKCYLGIEKENKEMETMHKELLNACKAQVDNAEKTFKHAIVHIRNLIQRKEADPVVIFAEILDDFIDHDSKHFPYEKCSEILRSIHKRLCELILTKEIYEDDNQLFRVIDGARKIYNLAIKRVYESKLPPTIIAHLTPTVSTLKM